jgi:dihydroorotase
MKQILILGAKIINEGKSFTGSVLIKDNFIDKIFKEEVPEKIIAKSQVINADGKWLIPGVIDEHVHFREPGLTQKADIESESKAAAAGGITSFMDMPNTIPQTTTLALVEEKCEIASKKSLINYSFYLGATNNNIDEIKNADPKKICGLKVFMGSSTGDMLVEDKANLEAIFTTSPLLIVTHNEDSAIIAAKTEEYKTEFNGKDIPIKFHPAIRPEEACYKSTVMAVEFAKKYNSRLHVLHVSTAKELALFDKSAVKDKKITAETCIQYLWFDAGDYDRLGTKIKCNPAIKSKENKLALQKTLSENLIDCIATDHAPHLPAEKEGDALTAVSGIPLIQHSLIVMLELVKKGFLTREKLVEKMCHNPATLFKIHKRGFIRKGYYADLVLINPDKSWTVETENILSKCAWSPFEGETFTSQVTHTFVNGNLIYENGQFNDSVKGKRLEFES